MDLEREEDAAQLHFGPDFDNASVLSISEVAYLFQSRQEKGVMTSFTPVFNSTLTYTQTFSKLKTKAAIQESRRALAGANLAPFECAQLVNLSPDTVGEAKRLIPSLDSADSPLTDDELQDLLDELKRLRKYA